MLPGGGAVPIGCPDAFGRWPARRLIEIPDGRAGALATLAYLAEIIRAPDPAVLAWAACWVELADAYGLSDTQLAADVFGWVQRHLIYTDDAVTPDIVDVVWTPAALLHTIARHGYAREDCDGYVALLGAVYFALGWPVTLVAIATGPDQTLDHVYLLLEVDGVQLAADGIIAQPLGWEVPRAEQTDRVEWPVTGIDTGAPVDLA